MGSEEIHPGILREVADIGARPLSIRSLEYLDITKTFLVLRAINPCKMRLDRVLDSLL